MLHGAANICNLNFDLHTVIGLTLHVLAIFACMAGSVLCAVCYSACDVNRPVFASPFAVLAPGRPGRRNAPLHPKPYSAPAAKGSLRRGEALTPYSAALSILLSPSSDAL